jgi:hypothetical protein
VVGDFGGMRNLAVGDVTGAIKSAETCCGIASVRAIRITLSFPSKSLS